jgi:hypothetical protein
VTPMRHQRRVAVTSPQTRVALAGRRTGAPFVPPHLAPADAERARRIHHRQLRYALTVLAMLAALLLGLPLVLAGAPALDAVRFVGIPISWLAVAVLPFPLLALLAGWQLRKAERAERSSGEGRRVGR